MVMSPFDSPNPDEGLITDEEAALLKSVLNSRVWRLIADMLMGEREALFRGNSSVTGLEGQPGSNEHLWKVQGAILLIQHLLQQAPRSVIWWRRYMDEQTTTRAARKKARVKGTEREYTPDPAVAPESPEFDIL